MNTLPMHKQADDRQNKFNGPILDRKKLREGNYVALLTAVGSVIVVIAVKALYGIF